MTATTIEPGVEIGGYFGMDLPYYGEAFPDTIKFQSGRAALRAALVSADIKHVLLPAYICDSVIQAIVDAGAGVETYRLDNSLCPIDCPNSLPEKSALLYVNYFGLCEANVTHLLEKIPGNQLIIDNSQALFSQSANVLATIYSPRKFVGVPDGGLLVASGVKVNVPEYEDTGTLARVRPLLLRMAYTAKDGYPEYLKSEKAFNDTKPLKMSRLSKRILNSIDMVAVKSQRRENFLMLAARLDKINLNKWELDSESVPLCYPLVVGWDVERLKKSLVDKGIYIPTYWPEVKPRATDGVEHRLINFCLAIPCDQRYSLDQMSYLADEIISGLDSK